MDEDMPKAYLYGTAELSPTSLTGELSLVDPSLSGELSSMIVSSQSKVVIPTTSVQVIIPDETYDYLSQVIVEAIPYVEIENEAGGLTAMIA